MSRTEPAAAAGSTSSDRAAARSAPAGTAPAGSGKPDSAAGSESSDGPRKPRHRAGSGGGVPRGVLRGIALLAALVVWGTVAGVGGPLVGRLAEVQENDNASFLPETAESTEVSERGAGFTQSAGLPFFLLVERRGGLGPDDLAAVQALAADLPSVAVPGGEGRTVGDYLTPDPLVPIPSADGESVLVVANVDAAAADQLLPDGEAALLGVAEALRTSLRDTVAEGATTAVGGPGGVLADLFTAFAGIDTRLLQVTLLVVFVILLLVYRSPVLPLVALLSAVFALAAAGLVVYPLADNDVIELNGQSQGIMSILVVGAATDYALLLISRYREELHHHRRPWAAMTVAWRASVEPIVASATTVVLGLLCLLLSDLGSTRGLGPVGAIGVAAAMLSVLTFLPVLLLAGRWLFWPRMPRLDDAPRAGTAEHGVWGRVARLVGQRSRVVWVVTAVVLGALAAFAPTFEASGTAQTDAFRDDVESVEGTR
ncbi:MAG TPA: MMPL family transporter, partial [Mycobacteriales bacterium]|nr:MMPL family transporter [Mycobacteriales bacterium]